MKNIIILFLLFTGVSLAQWATPSSYTTVLGLRLYDQSDNPGADSLNANWTDIDDWAGSVAEEDSGNTFTAIQTFNGADFNAGSHGTVTFADTVASSSWLINTGAISSHSIFPSVGGSYNVGSNVLYYNAMYARVFRLLNEEANDSVSMSFDDSVLTIGRTVNFTGKVQVSNVMQMDSASTFNILNFEPHSYTIPGTGDTVLTLSTSDSYSLIELDLPGNVTPGISKMQVDEATKGMVIKFYNNEATYTIIFEDIISGDDNLYLSADMTLGQYDYIEMLCIDATKGAQKWIETSRSNN